MPHPFERRYTPEQKAAIAHAYEDLAKRPARVVVEMAAAGTLEWKGEPLPPFETNKHTVMYEVRRLRKRRAGQASSELSKAEPRDAIEVLRRRLVNAADVMLAGVERELENAKKPVDPERIRQIARAVREVQAIPGPKDEARPAPGQRTPGTQNGGQTRGGLGGKLLSAHRQGDPSPAQDDGHTQQGEKDNGDAALDVDAAHGEQDDEEGDGPGSLVRVAAASLPAPAGAVP